MRLTSFGLGVCLVALLSILSSTATAESAYVLSLGNIDNTIVYSGITIQNTDIPDAQIIEGKPIIEQRDFSGLLTYKSSFELPTYGNFILATPYRSDTREIILKNTDNQEVLTVPVIQFADTCGSGVCEDQESFETCSQDCASGGADDYCDEIKEGICDPDCRGTTDTDCRGEVQETPVQREQPVRKVITQTFKAQPVESSTTGSAGLPMMWIFVTLAVVVVCIVGFVMASKKKGVQRELVSYVRQSLEQGYTIQAIEQNIMHNGYSEKDAQNAVKEGMGA